MSLTAGGEPLSVPDDAIRWTAEEMRVFATQGISINTLEYYAAIYFVMLWSHLFVGQANRSFGVRQHCCGVLADEVSSQCWQ